MMMIKKIAESKLGRSEPDPSWFGNPANEPSNPHWTNKNWLKSRFHFSFAEYNNPRNQAFGVLRVMNDDLVQPNRGFGEHPHRDAEICTYVVDGNLTHQDSMGTQETLTRGAVQFMSAGRGVSHSEFNKHPTEPLRFVQIWITPRARGLKPNYGSFQGTEEQRLNDWSHLVGDAQQTEVFSHVKVQQDVNIYVTELEPGRDLTLPLAGDRQAYVLCIEGCVSLRHSTEPEHKVSLSRHDASELLGSDEGEYVFANELDESSGERAHVLVVEMQRDGSGRTDV